VPESGVGEDRRAVLMPAEHEEVLVRPGDRPLGTPLRVHGVGILHMTGGEQDREGPELFRADVDLSHLRAASLATV
jgi:hypothetical protein